MIPEFSASCAKLVDRWDNFVGSDGSFELDVLPEMQKLARDIVSKAAFGCSNQEGKKIFELQAEQAELLVKLLNIAHIPFHRFVCYFLFLLNFFRGVAFQSFIRLIIEYNGTIALKKE
jgi:hypothetical protein